MAHAVPHSTRFIVQQIDNSTVQLCNCSFSYYGYKFPFQFSVIGKFTPFGPIDVLHKSVNGITSSATDNKKMRIIWHCVETMNSYITCVTLTMGKYTSRKVEKVECKREGKGNWIDNIKCVCAFSFWSNVNFSCR